MGKKPILVYSMASLGMGHATRSIPMIERLKKDYKIHIFTSHNAKRWLQKRYPNVHKNLAIGVVERNGKIDITLTALKAWLLFPVTLYYGSKIFLFILINRPVAVFSDFDLHAIYAARLANFFFKVPIIACDNFMNVLYSELPFELTPEEHENYKRWQKNIKFITNQADYYLVHKFLQTKLDHPKAEYVPIPIRDSYLEARTDTTTDGPIVISIGCLFNKDLIEALKKTPYKYIFFGHQGNSQDHNIQFHDFDDDAYLKALKAAPFSIVSGNSSAIDALALGKPILCVPHPGQFERLFCAKSYEYLGVGSNKENPNPEDIDSFFQNLDKYRANIDELDYFDNEKLYSIVKNCIEGG